MISDELEAAIVRWFAIEKWSIGRICGHTGLHHSVIERVLSQSVGNKKSRRRRPSKLDDYTPFLVETLKKYPSLCASTLQGMARERGLRCSGSHFRALVAQLRPKRRLEAYLRLRTLPGEQAQVDALVAAKSLDFNVYAEYVWRDDYLAESEDAFAYDRTAAGNLPVRLDGNNGLYPAPADINGWMCKFIEWGCPGFYKNTIAGQTYILPCLSGKFYNDKPDFLKNSVSAWFGTKPDGSLDPNWATPDNFLAYYGIPYDSDLVIGLLNRSWFVHGNQLSTYGLRYLLGSEDPDSAGGWLGFTQAVLSADTSVEAMLRILYASVDQPKPIPTDANKDSDPCSTASQVGSAVSSLGTAGGIAMCLPFPANLIVGVGAFAAQFVSSDYKCW